MPNLTKIAKKYKISYDSLRRHVENHLKYNIKEARAKYLQDASEQADIKFTKTMDYYKKIVTTFFEDPERMKDQLRLADVIRALENISKLLNETEAPPRIEIRWGAGLEKKENLKPGISVTIPMTSKEEKENMSEDDETEHSDEEQEKEVEING